ncbi:MAG: hypothetical protein Q4P08_06740 [Eubacteriales bacterium]|nr:hypothetical protein [Eubacteriales bacterium]
MAKIKNRKNEFLQRMLLLVTLLVILASLLVSCAFPQATKLSEKDLQSISFGLIETSSNKNKSYIHWYNDELEVITSDKLRYSSLGSSFERPICFEDECYMIPRGITGRSDSKLVISVNQVDRSIEEYPIDNLALNHVAVDEKNIYTVNTLNGTSHISALDRKSKAFREILLEAEYAYSLAAANGEVYCFSIDEKGSEPEAYLYIYSPELEQKEKINISEYGVMQYKFAYDGDYIYTASLHSLDNRPLKSLLKISTKTHEIETIDLADEGINEIFSYGNKLLVTHNDPVTGQGSKVSLVDKKTHEIQSFDLGVDLQISAIKDKTLLVVSEDKVLAFAIDKDFEKIAERQVDVRKDCYLSLLLVLK